MYALSMTKSRLSVTVDADLIAAVQAAVAAGAAESTSAWVSDALRLKLDHDRRLRGIGDSLPRTRRSTVRSPKRRWKPPCDGARERAIVVRGGKVVRNGMADTGRTGAE